MAYCIAIPEVCLVFLVGPSHSGKSSFAQKHFKPSEIVSSDQCRKWISDDEGNQDCSADAFALARFIVRKRLKNGKLTVIDATNVKTENRKKFLQLAEQFSIPVVAFVFDLPVSLCLRRNNGRVPEQTIEIQHGQLQRSLHHLKVSENFSPLVIFKTIKDIDDILIIRQSS
ncbi:MAG TPA: AAA family ATPase [Candidatus Nitrosotenuis sp.]|jgi:protein phosphatase|nr:AAA family ATPase [Candidatus Nitrosotenuis sp.]